MATIVDYASLTQAIADFTHRSDLAAYSDYFIQLGGIKLANDVISDNFGNGIEAMEVGLVPGQIEGGTFPVPADWFAPKDLQVSDGAANVFTLIFKDPAWMYANYPIREPEGLPAYIARDVMANAAFTASVAAGVLTVTAVSSGVLSTGMIYTGAGISSGATILSQTSGTSGGAGVYAVSNAADSAASENMTGGGNVFIFGPFPDSSYGIQGTYYSRGVALSASNTTNWMVQSCPEALHAACMVEASKFTRDEEGVSLWSGVYQDFKQALINRDKGERFAAGTLTIEAA